MPRQPLLHDLLTALSAPTQAWSAPDGQIRPQGAQGVFHGDVRVVSRAELTVSGEEPEVIAVRADGAGAVNVVALARGIDTGGADPTVRVNRRRVVTAGTMTERVELTAATEAPVDGRILLTLGADFAAMDLVKVGERGEPQPATRNGEELRWSVAGVEAIVAAPGAVVDTTNPAAPTLAWDVHVEPGVVSTLEWSLTVSDPSSVVGPPPEEAAPWDQVTVRSGDSRLAALVDQSLADLGSLRMSTRATPEDTFLAAGAPWFFTLFGRDSIWAARMTLPLGTDLAAGTLRTLARFQGTEVDVSTAEQPGKIVHEIRRAGQDLDGGTHLPPTYYGTIDATPLWISLLHDAWRWGMDRAEVEALAPNLQAALRWMADYGDADGDGFLEYIDTSGHGLANQGWKDSHDSIQWKDGRLAEGTIALCEVQGYAYEAALKGAVLLDELGLPGAAEWRAWAERLAERFRAQFWVSDDDGAYPAIALDGDKRPVDGVASNMGHLLGSGLLTAEEERAVVDRLRSARMSSGYGMRTLAHGSGGYWALRYHGGTVWPHDTAIVIHAMTRAGFRAEAATLSRSLVEAAPHFDYRLPELYAGDALGTVPGAVPYPAACRPQAWSAASAVVILQALLGLDADVPGGTLRLSPELGDQGFLEVSGLRLAGHDLAVAVAADGAVEVTTTAPVTVTTPAEETRIA